jgi:hypothetical protein
MARRSEVLGGLLLICALLLGMPKAGAAAISTMMYQTADFFSDIGDAIRAADRARDIYYQHRSGPDAARYEREWRDYESRLEEARIQRMAKEANISHHELRKMREDGRDWKYISDRYRIDSRKMGYGHQGPHGYDRDHDHDMYRHVYKKDHPGKTKGHKGAAGGPPGHDKHHDKDKRHDKRHDKDKHHDKDKKH